MNLLSLDLEHNGGDARSIIEIGVVAFNSEDCSQIERKNWLVRMPGSERVTEFITGLTGISNAMIDENGVSIDVAYAELVAFKEANACFMNPVVWGHGDMELLRSQVQSTDWKFGRRVIDAKTLYGAWRISNGREPTGGLKTACRKLGIPFEGSAHRATDDAWNTTRAFVRLAKSMKIEYPTR